MIPLSVPHLAGREWDYIKECLATGWVSSVGSYVNRFEQSLACCVGTQRGVATSSGTAALHIALLVAGVQPNDEVLVPTLTFIAPVNAVRYVNAWPVLIDAEPENAQMDIYAVASFLRQRCQTENGRLRNRSTGRRIAALLPVHVLGHPVEMAPLLDLAKEFSLPVIEDATESLGSFYRDRRTGSWGDIACFSFNGNKIITTGGGGMIVTDNPAWADRAKYLTTQAKDDPIEYIHHEIGYNYRLTNLQAALGCAQMEQLDKFVAARQTLARRYRNALNKVPGLRMIPEASWAITNGWLSTVLVDETTYGQSSRQLLQRLYKAGIESRPLWQPIHLSAAHTDAVHLPCPVAERLYVQALSLPSSSSLTKEEQNYVIAQIEERS
jgi:perosamine synthetase